jgi:hypothetical protein
MRCGDDRGQTTTEYLMMCGFGTGLAVFVLDQMGIPLQLIVQAVVDCVINERCF